MGMKNEVPKEYRYQFKSFVDYKDFMMEQAKNQLAKAFEKLEKNENNDWKENTSSNNRWNNRR